MKFFAYIITGIFSFYALNATEPVFTASSKNVQTVTVRLDPGDDIKQTLENFAKKHKIPSGCLLTCVGSVKNVRLRYAAQPKIDSLQGPFEIVSLTGTIAESGVHVHIAFADAQGNTKGGHMENGTTVFMTAEIIIAIIPDIQFLRETDPKTGFSKLLIQQHHE